ncbi:MAG: hypothetical protein JOZ43_00195 [Acidobacteriales bacterium]|nr:hypothetical protein [Terriglobales bacterium]
MKLTHHIHARTLRIAAASLAIAAAPLAYAQSASGTINAQLINVGGIAIVFDQNAAGVPLQGNGTSNATLNLGNISAYGPLSAGVTRTSVTAANFTVRSVFDVQVNAGGLVFSNSYSLTANLAAAAPAGMTYSIDGIPMTTAAQTVQTGAAYATDIPHNLDLKVSTASPSAGGPTPNTQISTVINFTATAN